MTDSERDPLVLRAVDELRRMPSPEPEAIHRVVAAAAAARLTPADEPLMTQPRAHALGRWAAWSIAAAGLVAVAALGVREMGSRALPGAGPGAVAATMAVRTGAPLSRDVRPVSSGDPEVAPLPHQFVFQSATARRIAVVGDFNEWNPADAPMTRDPHSSLWSITLPIAPGRHVYGFMIDDSLFALDPQEPSTRDPDLGTAGSVILVGKP
ncbi:MAG TPA: glycogen-binding domain-containing protein [Gemmatimonadaceae bacterium]|nr:glycogen-binding domain-containing protein [Gemmatimonadaceae bacterium]